MKIEGNLDLSQTERDTLIDGQKVNINYFSSKTNSYIQEFIWSKQLGLVSYTTISGEIFQRRYFLKNSVSQLYFAMIFF
ncbi:MAG: hypothetical protein LW701_12000 [Fluviicola sp.]|nr:hypothetical protein [Fluviicola sp.]